ncbi:MAG TPA: LacI family DNA-binding transcriptional regulator [Streptosporangiales bacterium]
MGRVTLQTIADELGVSRTTVSNAYSRPDQLAPALRERILATAQRLGYSGPDAAARTLRRGRAGAIGLLFTESLGFVLSDPFAVSFLHGIAETAEQYHSGLLLASSRQDDGGVDAVQNAVVDGFCIYCLEEDSRAFEAIRRRNLPYVQTFGTSSDPDVSFAAVDDRGAAASAARHLIELGHRRLAVISDCGIPDGHLGPVDPGSLQYGTDAKSRMTGYLDAAREAGLDPASVQFAHATDNSMDAGNAAMKRLLDLEPRPTGVLSITDMMALGALTALDEHGLAAGRDVSVVGFDDVPQAASAGLTTVRQPGREKGRVAARLLLDPPADPADRRVVLPTELVARASSGPPRSD